MVELVVRQICFGLAAAVPDAVPVGPFRLGDAAAEALSELLQVLACGEESAALAFAHFGCSPLEDAARRGLARVAEEELIHERLLRRVRAALPPSAPDRELRRALLRFYHGIAQADIGLHLASIAALDSAVCMILAALLEPDRALAREPAVATIFRRIQRDEAGHVRLSRRLVAELVRGNALFTVAENARLGLVGLLARRGAAFESLGVNAERLFARIARAPDGLFR
jgi:hypothetical protein